MQTIKIGIQPLAEFRAEMLAAARGERKPDPDAPKVRFPSLEVLAKTLRTDAATIERVLLPAPQPFDDDDALDEQELGTTLDTAVDAPWPEDVQAMASRTALEDIHAQVSAALTRIAASVAEIRAIDQRHAQGTVRAQVVAETRAWFEAHPEKAQGIVEFFAPTAIA